MSLYVGATADVSTAGAYVLTGQCGRFSADEILKVSLAIPPELRHRFPFARLMGLCRVARLERLSSADPDKQRGLALAFCQDAMTMLGAVIDEGERTA